jgi:outer membrane protein
MIYRTIATGLCFAGLQGISHGTDLWDNYQLALIHDATYRAASYDYETVKLNLPLAKSAFRPAVTSQGSAGWLRSDFTGSTNTDNNNLIDLNANLPVYNRTLRSEVSQAELQVDSAGIRFDNAQDDLILRVANRYFRLLATLDNREVARLQKISIQRQMDLASERLDVGLGTQTDLFDAQARFQQSVADVIEADNLIDNAVQALKQIIGVTPEVLAPLRRDAPLENPDPESIATWVEKALQNNLALKVEDLNLEIASEEIEKQRSVRWPSIDLFANQRWQDANSTSLTSADTNSTSVGATLNWPLYLGGSINIRTKQAAFQFNAIEQFREELRRQVESDTTSAYLAVTNGISQVEALSEAIRAGTSALKAKEEGFSAGLTTNIDVLDAQRDLSRSQTDYLGARYSFILSVLQLEQAIGDLDENDVKRVNGWLTTSQPGQQ